MHVHPYLWYCIMWTSENIILHSVRSFVCWYARCHHVNIGQNGNRAMLPWSLIENRFSRTKLAFLYVICQTSNIGYIFPSGNNIRCPWWASNISTTESKPLLMDTVCDGAGCQCLMRHAILMWSLKLLCAINIYYIRFFIHLWMREIGTFRAVLL